MLTLACQHLGTCLHTLVSALPATIRYVLSGATALSKPSVCQILQIANLFLGFTCVRVEWQAVQMQVQAWRHRTHQLSPELHTQHCYHLPPMSMVDMLRYIQQCALMICLKSEAVASTHPLCNACIPHLHSIQLACLPCWISSAVASWSVWELCL